MVWNRHNLIKIAIGVALVGIYLIALGRNARETEDRTLQLKDETPAEDSVLILVTVTSVTPESRQLTAQLSFRISGKIAQDDVTPRANLKLLVNNLQGEQEFNFPKGKRMDRISATFPLDGDLNRYPFDRYEANLSFLMTTPGQLPPPPKPTIAQQKSRKPKKSKKKSEQIPHGGELAVGETALLGNVPVPLSISLKASIPGVKFTGAVSRSDDSKITSIALAIKRPSNLIGVSMTVMIIMMSLALSVLAMALRTISTSSKFDFLPLSLSLSLIFGLPALRNLQPGIPPVGALGDYFSFIWAEIFVAVSAVIIMLTWLLRPSAD